MRFLNTIHCFATLHLASFFFCVDGDQLFPTNDLFRLCGDKKSNACDKDRFEIGFKNALLTHFVESNSSLVISCSELYHCSDNPIFRCKSLSAVEIFGCLICFKEFSSSCPISLTESTASLSNISLYCDVPTFIVPPFLESNLSTSQFACCGLLTMFHCSFSSMMISSLPFLFSEAVSHVSAMHSSFENISYFKTERQSRNRFTASTAHHYTTISSCSFFSVNDVYDGGLFHSINCPCSSLSSLNNTFISCNRLSNVRYSGTEENPLSLERTVIETAGEHLFVWCEWKNASPNGFGGAIYISHGGSSINVSHCLFNDINSTNDQANNHGGAIFIANLVNALVDSSNFSKCCANQGGAMCSVDHVKNEQCKDLVFENCSISSEYGMVCYLRPQYLQESGTFIFSNCRFVKNSAGDSAGCMYFSYYLPDISSSTFLITENVFLFNLLNGTSTSVSRYGGTGMNFDGLSEQAARISFIKFCFFHQNKANNGMGNDVRINGGKVTSNPFFESYSTTTEKRVWYNGTSDSEEYNGWLPVGIFLLTRYTHQNGNDLDELCGLNDTTPCRTIEHVFGKLRNDVECKVILLESSFSPSSVLFINSNKVKVIGNGTDKSVVRTSMLSNSAALFSINAGDLSIFSLEIDHNTAIETIELLSVSGSSGKAHLKHLLITSTRAQPTSFNKPLFDIAFGSISIDSCIVSSLRTSTQLIRAPISSFSEISNTNLTEVIRSSGNGGVIECNPINTESLTLNNISFSGCKCESGNGGCISIIMQPGSKARLGEIDSLTFADCCAQGAGSNGYGGAIFLKLENSANDFVFDKMTFTNCRASQFGNNIFIEVANFSQVINADRLKFSPQLNVLTDLCGYENNNHSFAIPLVLYLRSKPTEFYVGNTNKRDWHMCGFADEQCSTVDYVLLQHKTSSGVSIAVDGSSTLSREISLSEGTTSVRGIRAQTQLIVNDNSTKNQDGMIISSAITSFSSIKFYLPSSLSGREALFLVQSGSFLSEQCALMLMSSTTLSYSFIICMGGTSAVKSLVVKGFKFTEAPLMISCTNGQLNTELCNISNTTSASNEGIIECTNGGSLTLQNSTMEGIVCDNKAAITIENGKTVKVEKINMKSIELANGNGSAMNIVMNTGNVVEIRESTFYNCLAHSGCGGGIYASFVGSGKLSIGKDGTFTSFSKCGASDTRTQCGYGGGLFVKAAGQFNDYYISSISFTSSVEKNHATKGGNNMFFDEANLADLMNSGKVDVTISTNAAEYDDAMGFENGDTDYAIPLALYFIAPFPLPALVGGNNTRDFSGCGHSGYPCSTIAFTVDLRFSSLDKDILLDPSFIWSEETEMNVCEWKVKCAQKNTRIAVSPPPPTDSSSLITVTQPATITNITFVLSLSLNSRTSLIQCNGNSLTLNSCGFSITYSEENNEINFIFAKIIGGTFVANDFVVAETNKIVFSESPFLFEGGSSFTMQSCEFNGITVKNGNGGLLSAYGNRGSCEIVIDGCQISSSCKDGNELKGGALFIQKQGNMDVTVNNTRFSSCNVPNSEESNSGRGLGGGIYLNVSDNNGVYSLKNLTFFECKAWKGNNIFVDAINLTEAVRTDNFQIAWREMEKTDLMGHERVSCNRDYAIPLAAFLTSFSGSGYVGGESDGGYDHSGCGFSFAPCHSISKVVELRFGSAQEQGTVVVLPSFQLDSCTRLASCYVSIFATTKGTSIFVCSNASADGDGLIETATEVSISNITFSMPSSFVEAPRLCLILCQQSTLRVSNCSVTRQIEREAIQFSILCATGGEIHLTEFELKRIDFGEVTAVELSGQGTSLFVVGCTFEAVESLSHDGLIHLTGESSADIKKLTVNSSALESGSVISFGEGNGMKIASSELSNVTRNNGNGSVFSGVIGQGKRVEISNCVFSKDMCQGEVPFGGMGALNVSDGGELIFTQNRVESCTALGAQGYGGGLHLKFDANAQYSMKSNTFTGNLASKGNDLLLLCGNPETLIKEDLWFGTIDELNTPEPNFWVMDSVESTEIDYSIKKYLFSGTGDIIFVEAGKSTLPNCGSDANPCDRLEVGVGNLKENQTTVQINNHNWVSGEMRRDGKSLTIRGVASKSELRIESNGFFNVVDDITPTELLLNRLIFKLPISPVEGNAGVIQMNGGRVTILNCEFGGSDGSVEAGKLWIVVGGGGEAHLESVSFSYQTFLLSFGIARLERGKMSINNLNASHITSEGDGLIKKIEGESFEAKAANITDCSASNGGIFILKNVEQASISGGCEFLRCKSNNSDGGVAKCELAFENRFDMENVVISECEANETSGRGGGIFLYSSDDSTNNFKLGEMEFMENNAWCGRDLFVSCSDLNQTVSKSRFIYNLYGENEVSAVDMKGIDKRFDGEAIDLLLFLVKYESDEVFIDKNGFDMIGCGSLNFPCSSFWRGVKNANLNSSNRIIWICSNAIIQDEFDLSNFEVKSSVPEEHAKFDFASEILGSGSFSAIITNSKNLQFFLVDFVLPLGFNTNRKVLVSSFSENGVLHLTDCAFSTKEQDTLSYSLISASGGTFTLIRCSIEDVKFDFTPISASSSAVIEACNISGAKTENGAEGGALRISLKAEQQLMINKTIGKNCECSQTIGKGGFLFVDSTDSESTAPFVFDAITLEVNEAKIGEHIYILSNDLNATVKSSSFIFDYSSMENSSNLFVGSDDTFNSTNLFRFLEGYSNSQIYVSSLGFDVKRCGSADDPCFSFWKGMQQIDGSETKKEIIIHDTTVLKDSFVLSDFKICSGTTSEVEASHSTLAVSQEEPAEGKGLIRNNKALTFSWIILSVEFIHENGEETIVKNEDGTLTFEECWFSSTSTDNMAQNYVFVEMGKGVLIVDSLNVERIHTKRGVFDVFGKCECKMNKMNVLSSTIESGSIINVKNAAETTRLNMKTIININESTFFSVSRKDDGSCVSSSNCSRKSVEMIVKNSSIESCKALSSEKGGSLFFLQSSDGSLKVEDSRIAQCSCSVASGRGGGAYLECEERGELYFLFKNITFSGNEAFVGRDIFIECTNISNQINETQFAMDLRADSFIRLNAIYGIDPTLSEPVDLIDLITIYQASTIVISNMFGKGGANYRQCGTNTRPCLSAGYGIGHLVGDFLKVVAIDEQSEIEKEIEINDITIQSKSFIKAKLIALSAIPAIETALVKAKGRNRLESIEFLFVESFSSNHEAILEIDEGSMLIVDVAFKPENFNTKASFNELFRMEGGMLLISQVSVERIDAKTLCTFKRGTCQFRSVFIINVVSLRDLFVVLCENISMKEVTISNTTSQMNIFSFDGTENKEQNISMSASLSECLILNVSCKGETPIVCIINRRNVNISNCEIGNSSSNVEKGNMISFLFCSNVFFNSCSFSGNFQNSKENHINTTLIEICKWNGSLVDVAKSNVRMKDTTMCNSKVGGLSVRGGSVEIEDCKFENNNPSIEKYLSIRRNILCSDSGMVNVVSLKGGDGLKDNTSLWILDEGCTLEGIAGERPSALFIPVLESAEMGRGGEKISLSVRGKLLVPCNLSVRVCFRDGSEEHIEGHEIEEDGYVGENEIQTTILSAQLAAVGAETEVSVCILFGRKDAPSSTGAFILKNRSETQGNSDERIAEGGKEGKSLWPIIVIIMAIILMIVIIASVVVTIRWRKQKRRTEELEEIVNDNIRKDPKAFEMVTMEMSPEEQWKRAEREAEKKNEEKIKKRVYEKSLGHSESSEHLLSECGSTEYILGRDSDKIPEWALEKVEEEEIRKRSPSPSISSTSTTDTSDTESTFVRGEDLCPTTSSMSNLVDAMACSSPHEKLIVDLRDSLFMLLHGKNKTKEMAIGSLQEREMTAAQILFWVANGALHAFEDEEDDLPLWPI
ncbi:uncharacterized protein MONOS_15737 [Monocercomonoides exilis]|uniref:uncharacterized protein n=1 Tax=Monocercomonoides exilis TaxID=2049356 RepID=UPI00355947EE|nr:hypothetical protein MONOS_15737 [Monocercomonoides exilis]